MGFSLNYGVRVGAAKYSLRFFYFLTYVTLFLLLFLLFVQNFKIAKNSAANGLSDHPLQFNLTSRPFVELMGSCL